MNTIIPIFCNYLQSRINRIIIVFILMLFAVNFVSAQNPVFNNPTLVSGKKLDVGAKYIYTDVTTAQGFSIDAVVTINAIVDAKLKDIDSATNGAGLLLSRFQPVIQTTTNGGYVEFQFDFYQAGTYSTIPVPMFLNSFALQALDIDGLEFFDVNIPPTATYSLNKSTLITVSTSINPPFTRFQGPSGSVDPISLADTQYIASVNFSSASTAVFRYGNFDVNNDRQSSFSCGEVFFNVPTANNDSKLTQPAGPVGIDVTTNDTDPNTTLNKNSVDLNLSTSGTQNTLVVANQGTWSVNTSGIVTFTPLPSYIGNPTAIKYTINNSTGITSNQATITITYASSDLKIVKTVDIGSPIIGANVTFTFTASYAVSGNNSTGVVVNDVLPSGYTFINATPSTGTWSAPNWTIGNFNNGSTATMTIVATVNPSGDYSNTATISGNNNDPQLNNNTNSISTNPKLVTLSLTGSTICVLPGGNGTITSITSATGVSYQLYNSSNVAVQASKDGTGSGLTWSGLSAANGYYVIAATDTDTKKSSNVNIDTTPNPVALSLTGSSFCAVPGGDGTITSSTSVSGTTYQLYNSSNVVVQASKNGTGSGLTWTGLSAANGYYVIASNTASCTSTCIAVNVVTTPAHEVPTVSVVNNCDGTSTLTASNCTGSLLWSNGATTASITVTTAGTYTVIQSENGCNSPNGTGLAAPKNAPAAPTVSVVNNCDGTATLTASNYTGTLLWSNGASTASITVTTAGTYTVAQTLNGCTSPNGSGTAAPKLVHEAPTVSVVNNCDGTSTLTASNCSGSLLWSNNATTATITVTTAGTYTVTQSENGCSSPNGTGTAAPKNAPAAPIVSVVNNCDGTSTLTASNYTGTLLWSNSATTASITVNTAGTYTVNQSINGCTSPNATGLAAPKNAPAAPIVSVVNNCDGTSTLTASNYTGTLLWSNSATTASITVNTAGTYTVNQSINGCTSPNATGLAAPKNAPAAPIVSVVNNCDGTSTFTASNYTGTLLWSNGATTASITVNAAGTYTVTQSANGCISPNATGAAAPKTAPDAPTVSVVNNCDGTATLTASNYTGTLLWSNSATTASITVNTAATYTVNQSLNGCTSPNATGTAAPKNAPAAPTVGVVNNCDGTSTLTASNCSGSLLWSNNATTATITVTTAGTYTVTQSENGCSSPNGTGTAAPKNAPAAPTVSVVNNCDGTSTLTASNYTGTLLWSNSATTASITVNTAGTYTVNQSINGCTSPNATGLATPKNAPAAPIVSVVNNCDGTSTFTASNYTGTLLWSNGATTASITVNTAGTYTVTQSVNGCISPNATGAAAPKTAPDAPTVSVVNNCDGTSTLTASNHTGTLLWSNSATTASITVNTAATYTVNQSLNGCTSPNGIGTAAPKNAPAAPTVSVVNNCDGTSTLTASNYTGTLLWSNGATTDSITVTTAGTYTVIQSENGCTSANGSGTAAPKTAPDAPKVSVVNNCDGTATLTASNYTGTLLWSNGATTDSITVTTAGTYTVTQSKNGCTSANGSGLAAPKNAPTAPTVSIVNNCDGTSTLTASNYTGSLLWRNGATTASITVNTAGTYTVTQSVNGCISPNATGAASPKNAPAAPTVSVVNNCDGTSTLTASNYTGTLLWSNGATAASITVTTAGTYTVAQSENGCTSANGSGLAAPKNAPAAPTVSIVNNCDGTATLTASNYTGTLLWSNGATTASITVTTAGTYTVAQSENGCTSPKATGAASPKNAPAAPTVSVVNNCDGTSTLTASNYTGTLLWSNGATAASITVTTAGTYTVAQSENGCTSPNATGTAAPKNAPAAPTVSVVNNCDGTATLTASNYTGTLLWSNSATTASITVTTAGTYTVTQSKNGCTSPNATGTAAPKNAPAAPTVSVVNNCDGTATLTASNYTGTLLWSNGATTASITVNTAATYTVTQTVNGCTSPNATGTAAPKSAPNTPETKITQPTCNINTGTITVVTPIAGLGVLYTVTGTIPVVPPISNTSGIFDSLTPGIYNVATTYNSCNSSPKTVTIDNYICANDDTIAAGNGTTGNTNAGNVFNDNGNGIDTLNGNQPMVTTVNLAVTTPATPIVVGAPVPSVNTATGQISVPVGTPAGSYTIVYSICEKINPSNCDSATILVTVTAPGIIAQDDTIAAGNGTTGTTNAGNVFNNNGNGIDTLNGNQATVTTVNLAVTTPATPIVVGSPVPAVNMATGQIIVPVGTPAGSYTIVYSICEKINPPNCDSATIVVTVTAPGINAQDDTIAAGNGTTGNTNAGNVFNDNGNGIDTLNGNQATVTTVNLAVTTPATPIVVGAPVPAVNTATGQISVPVGTPAGSYTIVYSICEKINPSNCDSATIVVTVTAPGINAQDDTIAAGNGTTGNTNAGNVFNDNGNGIDTLNGNQATVTTVNLAVTTPATPIVVGAPVPAVNTATGQISVPVGTPAGSYTIVYSICEKINPSNCDSATISVTVTAPGIIAQDDTIAAGNGTTGNTNAGNVFNDNGNGIDTLNGGQATVTTVNLAVTTPATPIVVGAPVPAVNTATGQISVPAGTPAGSYTIVYSICEKINPSNCDSATIVVTVTCNVSNTIVPSSTCNSDSTLINLNTLLPVGTPSNGIWIDVNNSGYLQGNILSPLGMPLGDYVFIYKISGDDCQSIKVNMNVNDKCTVLPCGNIIVHNAISVNGYEKNRLFAIENIDNISCYPENTVEIYNRWGVLVYETRNYNNVSNVFDGTSHGRTTLSQSSGLPTGTYYYILNYTSFDNNDNVITNTKDGFLYLTR
ncbi:T9SS type B sorting domain-containing protein [Flavobacterium cellulosilyticum]|uniref:DUF11 domain-containing protein n=1 Tax=Flavobacterium cellulosilyticum TaxID=2541731 RepID=A0A4R5C1X4_9FLAO|nr:gliding motility-associated C-terminal domain-containing protein [Flavobacterium cellulosilyticum]TDD93601.1 hypothetical protein E0F76_18810 [Flavobacterium cellulosilyticum]